MNYFADWNETHFDMQDWDVIDADDPFLAPFDDRERDGWSEQYDYADDDDFGGEDSYIDSYWEAQGEAMLAFWGE
jgi:hypothetical protein